MQKIQWKEMVVPGGIIAAVLFGGYWLFMRKPQEATSPALPKPTIPPSLPSGGGGYVPGSATGDLNAGSGGLSGTFTNPNQPSPADLGLPNFPAGIPGSIGNVLNQSGIPTNIVTPGGGVQPTQITTPSGGSGTYAVSISSGSLNARSGPANVPNEANVVFKLAAGETVSHIEGPVSGDGSQGTPPSGGWVKVRRGNGATGWVSKRYLRVLTPIQEAA